MCSEGPKGLWTARNRSWEGGCVNVTTEEVLRRGHRVLYATPYIERPCAQACAGGKTWPLREEGAGPGGATGHLDEVCGRRVEMGAA